MRLSSHFTLAELTRTSTGLYNIPGDIERARLVTLCTAAMEPIREALGVPIRITSGYRSQAVNSKIGGASASQHKIGEAADFVPVGYPGGIEAAMAALAAEVRAGRLVVDQLIAYTGGAGFMHVSYTTRRANRGQLLRSTSSGGSGGPYLVWTP
jgi:hypothetical protein